MTEDEIIEYYARTARVAMHNHRLNPDNGAALATWARAAAEAGHTNRGVLVTGDGRLWAETVNPPKPVGDGSGRRIPYPPWQINPGTWPGGNPPEGPRALSDAMETIKGRTGCLPAHIVYREVCTGWVGMWGPNDPEQN